MNVANQRTKNTIEMTLHKNDLKRTTETSVTKSLILESEVSPSFKVEGRINLKLKGGKRRRITCKGYCFSCVFQSRVTVFFWRSKSDDVHQEYLHCL